MSASALEAGPASTGARARAGTTLLFAGVLALLVAGILLRYGVFVATTGKSGPQAYIDGLCVWDCGWFRTIVADGYDAAPGMRLRPGGANWPFFPAYPMTVAALIALTGLAETTAAFILSSLYILLATLVARPLFGSDVRAFWLFAITLLIGPFSFLFNTMYSESLFILLTALVLLMLQRGHYLAAGGFAALLSATRLTGVLIVFAILVQALVDHLTAGRRVRDFPLRVLADPGLMLALVIAPLGLFVYMAYLYGLTGDAFAFVHIERAWGRSIGNPLDALWHALTVPWPLTPDSMIVFSWGAASAVALLLCLLLLLQRRFAAATFCTLSIVVSLAGGVGSMVRFAAGLFPLGMALSILLARSRVVFALTVAAAVAADIVLTQGWLRSSLFVM